MNLKRLVRKLFNYLGFELSRTKQSKAPKEFLDVYKKTLETLLASKEGRFQIFEKFRYDAGMHPKAIREYECEFAARQLSALPFKSSILDIGSYREFILGITSRSEITTIDVRDRKSEIQNEIVVTSDAKHLALPDNKFDAVVSISSIEHFGLGRYGDEIDLNADKKAVSEMKRVLKPGGRMIFTVPVVRTNPAIAFNCERVYSLEMIKEFCSGLKKVEEKFYSRMCGSFIEKDKLSENPKKWDVYMGAWEK